MLFASFFLELSLIMKLSVVSVMKEDNLVMSWLQYYDFGKEVLI